MSFSIIIPSRNIENLLRCVAAIRSAGELARVIVIWDGDETPSIDWSTFPDHGSGCYFHWGPTPFCFARNCNIGIRAAGADDVFIWNDDALLEAKPESRPLTDMVRAIEYSIFESNQPWGVVSCAVSGHAGQAYLSANVTAEWRGKPRSLWPIREPMSRKMVPFTAVYIPRRVIDAVGLLDDRFAGEINGEPVYGGEDDAYCYECRKRGFSIGVFDGAVVNHGVLPSTFRPDGKGRSIEGARMRFQEIYGFQMGTRWDYI